MINIAIMESEVAKCYAAIGVVVVLGSGCFIFRKLKPKWVPKAFNKFSYGTLDSDEPFPKAKVIENRSVGCQTIDIELGSLRDNDSLSNHSSSGDEQFECLLTSPDNNSQRSDNKYDKDNEKVEMVSSKSWFFWK